MSHTTSCTDCHRPIPAGLAVIRTNSRFQRIYLHKDCATLRGIETATLRMTVEAHIRPLRDAS